MHRFSTLSSNPVEKVAPLPPGSVVDLFCGAGGLTHGLLQEGFAIAAGVDQDEACRYAYERNNLAPFVRKDVEDLTASELAELFYPNLPRILVGCAPCQPFSTYKHKGEDLRWRLLGRFADLIADVLPDVVSMENVPRLLDFRDGSVFRSFERTLESCGYRVWKQVVSLPDYGLPQNRSRLVLLASRLGPIGMVPPTHPKEMHVTVSEAIGHLPEIGAGEADPVDALHAAAGLSDLNLRRLRASRPGGTWTDWDEELVATCHREKTGKGYKAVYGRMRADRPAPTITTQFYGFGSGRFGHPSQDRALSLREGALLQSFPADYAFGPPGCAPHFTAMGRMIGNAVPVGLARAVGRSILAHLAEHGR